MPLAIYRREEVAFLTNGVILKGFIAGAFCAIERADDQTTLEVGTHGEVDANFKFVPNGTVVVTCMASSLANDVLQGFKTAWDAGGAAVFALLIRDTNASNTLASCPNCIIAKDPDITFGDTRGQREWTILCPDLRMAVSGAARLTP